MVKARNGVVLSGDSVDCKVIIINNKNYIRDGRSRYKVSKVKYRKVKERKGK